MSRRSRNTPIDPDVQSLLDVFGVYEKDHPSADIEVYRQSTSSIRIRVIDPDQAWYWTPEWQEGEREVDAEIAPAVEDIAPADAAVVEAKSDEAEAKADARAERDRDRARVAVADVGDAQLVARRSQR